jgi:hypothetical protein
MQRRLHSLGGGEAEPDGWPLLCPAQHRVREKTCGPNSTEGPHAPVPLRGETIAQPPHGPSQHLDPHSSTFPPQTAQSCCPLQRSPLQATPDSKAQQRRGVLPCSSRPAAARLKPQPAALRASKLDAAHRAPPPSLRRKSAGFGHSYIANLSRTHMQNEHAEQQGARTIMPLWYDKHAALKCAPVPYICTSQ